jgi:predicted nucleic-acid-binding Zn-ribbon protein
MIAVKLTMRCPECQDTIYSVSYIHFDEPIEEIDLNEFVGLQYECKTCGYSSLITSVEPRDNNGKEIY